MILRMNRLAEFLREWQENGDQLAGRRGSFGMASCCTRPKRRCLKPRHCWARLLDSRLWRLPAGPRCDCDVTRLGISALVADCRLVACSGLGGAIKQGLEMKTRRAMIWTVGAFMSSAFGPVSGAAAKGPAAKMLQLTAMLRVEVGSSASLNMKHTFTRVTAVRHRSAAQGPVTATLANGTIVVSAGAAAKPGVRHLDLRGSACAAKKCRRAFKLRVRIVVLPLKTAPGVVEAMTEPSPDRTARAEDGILQDELLVTVGNATQPGSESQAIAAAKAAHGTVTGGFADIGVYQVRWPRAQSLAQRRDELDRAAGVTAVGDSTVGLYAPQTAYAPVVQAAYDDPYWTWRYDQVNAQKAWSMSTGSNVKVGIVDQGNVFAHPDLNVAATLDAVSVPAVHATHVAGLACAKANNGGLVGMAWGCPIVTAAVGGQITTTAVLAAMHQVATTPGVRVANASLGTFIKGGKCADAAQVQAIQLENQSDAAIFRQLFESVGRNIVWTFAAGNNCAPGVASAFAANSDLPNVIAVAATNSDGTLAEFSDYGPGVSVAAPGGVYVPSGPIAKTVCGTGSPTILQSGRCGLLSTTVGACTIGYCPEYGEDEGTSMAAPIVAGIAALVYGGNLSLNADQVGTCIKATAGTGGVGSTHSPDGIPEGWTPLVPYSGPATPIVNAAAAVECGIGGGPSAGTGGGSTSTSGAGGPSSTGSGGSGGTGIGTFAGSWSIPTTSSGVVPDAVACVTSNWCEGVGAQASPAEPGALQWNGSNWNSQSAAPSSDGDFLSVSCSSSSFCVATGATGNDGLDPLLEMWNGTSWTTPSLPIPGSWYDIQIASVSCVSTTSCMAVGWHDPDEGIGTGTGFAMQWNGADWTLDSAIPTPAGSGFSGLFGVSCQASSSCIAVGLYAAGLGDRLLPLVVSWNGSTWSFDDAPDPSNGQGAQFSSVSCTPSSCMAVGDYYNGTNGVPMADWWNGTTWASVPPPAPSGAYESNLDSGSCVSSTACMAVGYSYASSSGPQSAIAYAWDGTAWTVETLPSGPNGDPYSLDGISCASITSCLAVGSVDSGAESGTGITANFN